MRRRPLSSVTVSHSSPMSATSAPQSPTASLMVSAKSTPGSIVRSMKTRSAPKCSLSLS